MEPELRDVFALFSRKYLANNNVHSDQRRAMFAIEHCRTSVMGGRIDKCNSCQYSQISYNSCRNRHCPKCQQLDKEEWIEKLNCMMMPVKHFHVVFTLPSELNFMIRCNQKLMYDILFKAASKTILQLSSDASNLGVETGLVAVLHTWGQNLMDHPHLHVLVPSGGWSVMNGYWKASPKKFFLPVKMLSKVFKGKFLSLLKEARAEDKIRYPGKLSVLKSKGAFKNLLNTVYNKDWVIYCKRPFKNSLAVVSYLARYTHRTAISNNRIISIQQENVVFSWKDYRDGGKRKIMHLHYQEFIRRYLLHVLPKGYCRIRYYGIYANKNRKLKLTQYKMTMGIKKSEPRLSSLGWEEKLRLVTGIDVSICPNCKKGKMIPDGILKPRTPT